MDAPYCTPDICLEIDKVRLEADLTIPAGAVGLVIFAHGCGSTRHTYRNCDVAAHLQTRGFGTLLFDLLSRAEDAQECIERRRRHDITLLSRRLIAATEWIHSLPQARGLRLGFFGANTGATAALVAAAELPGLIEAVVARGGRPDHAGAATLARIAAPTLLLVGGWDDAVREANRESLAFLRCEKQLEIIPCATHRFEEAGAIPRVSEIAASWFQKHLGGSSAGPRPLHVRPTVRAQP